MPVPDPRTLTLELWPLGGPVVALASGDALSAGGSGCGLNHLIITYGDELQALAPAALSHDNMGGLFIGDLGGGRGPGLVLFDAQWGRGSHYDPHSYRVWTYRWKDERFIGPSVKRTKPMTPDPERVARTLPTPTTRSGYAFRQHLRQRPPKKVRKTMRSSGSLNLRN